MDKIFKPRRTLAAMTLCTPHPNINVDVAARGLTPGLICFVQSQGGLQSLKNNIEFKAAESPGGQGFEYFVHLLPDRNCVRV